MCDLTSVLSFGATTQQGKIAKQQANYQAALAQNQKKAAEQMAKDARERARIAETEQRRKNSAMIGKQRSMLAANGVEMDTGSALDVQGDMAAVGELEALRVRNKGEREAMGFDQQAVDAHASSLYKVYEGKLAQRQSMQNAFSSLLKQSEPEIKTYINNLTL